jgi:hypothetical protein
MKKNVIFLFLLFNLTLISYSQETQKILEEGKLLYRLEKASWYGTDDMLVRFTDLRENIGGYLSYESENHKVVNIFFSKTNPYEILFRYYFDSLPQVKPYQIDTTNHIASQYEYDLITIRQEALNQIKVNKDDFFTFYKKTSFNLIPLIKNGKKRVFIITGPSNSGVVIIGNDYLLTYNKKNKFKKRIKIHQTMLKLPYKSEDTTNQLKLTVHSHVLSDCISSTDICTFLLYKEFVEWKQHYVISKKYVSIFDFETENLVILPKKAWENFYKDKNPKN